MQLCTWGSARRNSNITSKMTYTFVALVLLPGSKGPRNTECCTAVPQRHDVMLEFRRAGGQQQPDPSCTFLVLWTLWRNANTVSEVCRGRNSSLLTKKARHRSKYMYTESLVHIHTRTHTHIHARRHIHTHAHTYTHMHARMQAHLHTHTQTHTAAAAHAYVSSLYERSADEASGV